MIHHVRLSSLIGLAVVAASAYTASAALIAKDSYLIGTDGAAGQYDSGGIIRDESNTVAGFSSPGGYSSGTGTAQFSSTSNGLVNATLASDASSSGKVNFSAPGVNTTYRANARNLSPALSASQTTGTFWITHLVNRGSIATSGGTGYALTGFANAVIPDLAPATGTPAGLFVGFAQDGVTDNFGNLVIRSRTTATNTNTDTILVNGATTSTFGNTYLVVMKIEMNPAGSTDPVTWWLDPTNGSSEAALTSSAAASGTFNSFALANAADLLRLNYSSRSWNGNVFFDEPRLSTDLAGLALVPEPGGLALAGVVALGLLRRRRHV